MTFERTSDAAAVAALAKEIWTEHYLPLLGEAQVRYMLETVQSEEAVRTQMEQQKVTYFLLREGGETAGYLGWQERPDELFLSKLYLKKEFRGRGLGRAALDFAVGMAERSGKARLFLTVNKANAGAIAAYERAGLTRAASICTDIGGGFVMDDYVYELKFRGQIGRVTGVLPEAGTGAFGPTDELK